MGRREKAIIRAILKALLSSPSKYNFLQKLWALFSILNVPLQRFEGDQFRRLREETWQIDEGEYWQSFKRENDQGKVTLNSLAELGFSGSTFFETLDHKYLIKSLPRSSESEFFKQELKDPYFHYMHTSPDSLLVRMTDFLYSPVVSIGSVFGLVPRHHVVMENVLSGKENNSHADNWETYDLKPADYFYPERDVLDGNLASAESQDKVVDHFNDKIRITKEQYSDLMKTVHQDTDFLRRANAVDYSLFLVRYPADSSRDAGTSWRTGILSSDKKWNYRAVILDFFWSKHQLQAKAMTALIKTYNTIDNQGPMSLTTSAAEFKDRFCAMIEALVEARQ